MVHRYNLPVGKINRSSLATWIMKNRRSGVTKKRPKKEQIRVIVKSLPRSSMGSVLIRSSWYMAGRAATKRPAIPPAPVAAAWIMVFSCGPKEPPRIGVLPVVRERNLTIPYPKMAPNMLALKVKPVFRPEIVSKSPERGGNAPTEIQIGGINERAEDNASHQRADSEDMVLDGVRLVDRERLEQV